MWLSVLGFGRYLVSPSLVLCKNLFLVRNSIHCGIYGKLRRGLFYSWFGEGLMNLQMARICEGAVFLSQESRSIKVGLPSKIALIFNLLEVWKGRYTLGSCPPPGMYWADLVPSPTRWAWV